jgi:hypothetical protein
MLEFLGGLLDNPGRAYGIDPSQFSTQDRNAYRGRVLGAAFDSLRTNGPSMGANMDAIAQNMSEQQKAELARQKALAEMQQQQQLAAVFGQAPGAQAQGAATQDALGAPVAEAGRVGPTPQRAGMQQQALQQFNPTKAKADQYRQAANIVAATNPGAAEKYLAMADRLDPRPEYFAPTPVTGPDGKPTLAQFGKYGEQRAVNGFAPAQPDLPGDVRALEYVTGQPLAGTGQAGVSALGNYRKTGATTVTNTLPGQGPFIETLAKGEAAALPAAQAEAVAASRNNENLNRIIAASQAGTFSGPLAQGAVGAAQFFNALGVSVAPEMLTNTRLTQVSINQILGNMMAALGARGLTDKDMEIITNAMPTVADDPRSRIVISQVLQAANQRTIEAYNTRRQRALKMPGAEYFVGPEVTVPSRTPGNRPPLTDIFK